MSGQALKLHFTVHAENMLAERNIDRHWVEAALVEPDWTEPDLNPDRKRAFRAIAQAGGKILRVVFTENSGEFRIVTAFFDRNAKRP
jgi:hypothetical protein